MLHYQFTKIYEQNHKTAATLDGIAFMVNSAKQKLIILVYVESGNMQPL